MIYRRLAHLCIWRPWALPCSWGLKGQHPSLRTQPNAIYWLHFHQLYFQSLYIVVRTSSRIQLPYRDFQAFPKCDQFIGSTSPPRLYFQPSMQIPNIFRRIRELCQTHFVLGMKQRSSSRLSPIPQRSLSQVWPGCHRLPCREPFPNSPWQSAC